MKKYILIVIVALLGISAVSAYAAKPKTETVTATYVVSMHCQNCVNKITDKVSFIKGVSNFKVSLKDKTVTVRYNPSKVEEKTIIEAIEKLGYTVTKKGGDQKADSSAGKPASE